jgi:GDP-L-fucose synthase
MMIRATRLADFYRGKKVLVTGGAGFIGSHLVEMLVELGAVVTIPVRKTTRLHFLKAVDKKVGIIEADLFERHSVEAVMKGQEIVMHLAAAKGGGIAHSMRHHGSLFRDNMLSFINVLDSARCESVARFLVVSSACVYPQDAKIPIPEEEGFRDAPEPTNAGYGWSKRMEEYLAQAFTEEYGMNVGIVRPFNAYGPRDDFFLQSNHVIPGIITRLFNGEDPLTIWGTGKQTRSFLYVTDFARGLLQACAHEGMTGPLNLGSDEEISISDLAKLIVELSGTNRQISFDASKPDGHPRKACDTRRAKEIIGFQAATSLRDGLERTIEWYKQEKQAKQP